MRNSASSPAKEKSLSIHIATDYVGPNGLPLIYGSTPDRVGTIKGVVRFSSNHECRGKDIAILYEAKAEAQWTAFENKKLVQHHTEEILGHHIWHFPLEHTKPGGKKIVPGSYEKEFEVSLIHPSVSNKSSHVFSSPTTPSSSSSPIMSTQAAPVVLLPSSSDNPHAKMKYTIRAILRRPFPSIHNIEASQEVWVLHSSLPPPSPPKKISIPRKVLSMSTSDQLAKPSAPDAHDPASARDTTTPQTKPSHSSTSNQNEPSPSTTSDPIPSLSTPSNVFKSALSMFPSIDLLRPKQPLNNTATTQATSPRLTTEQTIQEEPNKEGKTSSIESSASDSSTSESSSSLDYSTSASTGPLSRSPTETSRTNSSSMDEDSMGEDEDSANYTGVWEPFQIPYSCSLPSETVYLGQTVPVSIQFGPTKHGRRRRRESKRRKDRDGKRFGSHHHHHRDEDIDEEGQESEQPYYRFVVKKGILKVVEHTHLREVTVVPVSLKNKKSAQALNAAPANNTLNAHQQQRQQQQQQQNKASQDLSSGQLIIPGIVKNQNQGQIYQEKAYSGSHPDLYEHLQEEPSEDLRVHQHSRSDLDNGFKRFFNPKRHSVDVASRNPQAINPTPIRTSPPPITVQSPTAQGFPPLPGSANSASTRIINSIEAKFKTEVMTVSLTPQLQQRERQYQRHLHDSSRDQARDQARDQDQEQNQSEEEDQKMTRHKSHRGNVWRTTIWIQIPGPSELATFTSTKHIVKKHTLQLILLCGLVDDSGRSEIEAETEQGAVGSFDGVINQPGIDKEFRLEMDLNVTGPRAPEETRL